MSKQTKQKMCGYAFIMLWVISITSGTSYNPDLENVSAYECGFDSFDDARSGFDIHFYSVAMLFVIFDLEVSSLLLFFSALFNLGN